MSYFSTIMNKVWPKKIRSQLILGIVIVHLLLMGIFVYDMINRQRNFLKKQNQEQTISMVSDYALNSGIYIISHDLDGLERLTLSQSNFPNLKYAMILSPDGVVLTHTNSKYIGAKPNDSISLGLKNLPRTQILFENNFIFDVATPVLRDNKLIGWARVGIGQEHIHQNLLGIVRSGILYMVIALVVGAFVAISIGNRLSKGLYTLIGTTDKIKEGDRNLRVARFKSFELSRLGTAFNQMLDDISAHERLLEMVLENLPVGVFVMNDKGKISNVNPAGEEIWKGVKYVGIESFGEYKAWHTDTKKPVKPEEWGLAIAFSKGEKILNHEIGIECFDGSTKTILNSAIPLKDDKEKKIIGAIAINVDITERKQAEMALFEANHNIGERIKELSCLYSMTRLANDPKKSMGEILQACVEIIPLAYQYPEITCARIFFNGQEYLSKDFVVSNWRQSTRIKSSPDKDLGFVEVYYTEERPVLHEGPFMHEERLLINSIADILITATERKTAVWELKQSEEKFRSLVEQSLIGVFIVQNEKFIYINPGLEMISGYTSDELVGKVNFLDLIHEDDYEKVKLNHELRISGKKPKDQYVFKAVRKDKKVIYIETIVSQIIYGNEMAVIGSVVDITDRIEEEKRILRAVNDAQEKERRQIGMELHDNVKQMIAASIMNLDFAKMCLNDVEMISGIIIKVIGYLTDCIDELRRISHQLAPSMDETLTLEDRVKILVGSMNVSKNLNVSYDIDDFTNEVNIDVQLAFYRILQEQFTNITKYAQATSVKVNIRQKNSELVMNITDNGVGFDTSSQRNGIGLENIKRRAQVLNGDVKITSAPGKGCSLEVHVPVA